MHDLWLSPQNPEVAQFLSPSANQINYLQSIGQQLEGGKADRSNDAQTQQHESIYTDVRGPYLIYFMVLKRLALYDCMSR